MEKIKNNKSKRKEYKNRPFTMDWQPFSIYLINKLIKSRKNEIGKESKCLIILSKRLIFFKIAPKCKTFPLQPLFV